MELKEKAETFRTVTDGHHGCRGDTRSSLLDWVTNTRSKIDCLNCDDDPAYHVQKIMKEITERHRELDPLLDRSMISLRVGVRRLAGTRAAA